MLLSFASAAWAWEPAEPVSTPIGAVAAVVASADGAVATGPSGTFLVRDGVASRVGEPGVALAAVDVDRDGRPDVFVCGPAGLRWINLARPDAGGVVHAAPCLAVAATPERVAWVGPDGIERLALAGPTTGDRTRVSDAAPSAPLLALLDDRLAVAERGDNVVTEVSARGTSSFTTAGPIAALHAWDGRFAWALPDRAVVADASGREVAVAPLPSSATVADLDGTTAWITAHGPDRVGVVAGQVERIYPAPGPITALAAGDVDADGCADLIVGTDVGVAVSHGLCAVTPAPPLARMPRRVRFDACTAMAGIAFGGTYATSWETVGDSPFDPSISPALALACELAGPLKLFGGLDSAIAFRYAVDDDITGSHVFGVSGGFLYGGDRFRIGPVGTVGTVLLGAGARALWMPFGGDGRTLRGFEARVLALGPTSSQVPAVEVMVMYGVELREFR